MESYSDYHALVRQGYTYVVDQRAQADASTSTYFTATQRCFGSSAFIVKITFNTKETIKISLVRKVKPKREEFNEKWNGDGLGWTRLKQITNDELENKTKRTRMVENRED